MDTFHAVNVKNADFDGRVHYFCSSLENKTI